MLIACGRGAPPHPAAPDVSEPTTDWTPRVVKVTERVYSAVGYALANSIMVAVDGGKVIVDTTESVDAAREIRAEFDRIAPGPVLAVVYTHTHPDHILGASLFRDGDAPIYAGSRSVEGLNEQFASLSTALRARGALMYGEALAPGSLADNGIGPRLRVGDGQVPPVLYPTQTFTGEREIAIGGVRFVLHEAPGETEDQIFVHLPDEDAVLAGDNLYKTFPNLYSLRGVPPRPVKAWIASLDAMRALAPKHLVPSHTEPVSGAERVTEILTAYRDGIAWVHDSVIRGINAGLGPDALAESIQLPPHLRDHPYLRERYGTVEWSARGIYDGYMGWFDANPTGIHPLPAAERAQKTVAMMGGAEAVKAEIARALAAGEAQWAAELCDYLLATSPDDAVVKSAKADAFDKLGAVEPNPNARSFYLTTALKLRGRYEGPGKPKITSETLRELPIEVILNTFPERLDPAKTSDVNKTIRFRFTDTGREFAFYIRRGVGEMRAGPVAEADLELSATEADFKEFLIGAVGPAAALATGTVKFSGGVDELVAFSGYLLKP